MLHSSIRSLLIGHFDDVVVEKPEIKTKIDRIKRILKQNNNDDLIAFCLGLLDVVIKHHSKGYVIRICNSSIRDHHLVFNGIDGVLQNIRAQNECFVEEDLSKIVNFNMCKLKRQLNLNCRGLLMASLSLVVFIFDHADETQGNVFKLQFVNEKEVVNMTIFKKKKFFGLF